MQVSQELKIEIIKIVIETIEIIETIDIIETAGSTEFWTKIKIA